MDYVPVIGALIAGGKASDKLAQAGLSKGAQRLGAQVTTAVHMVAGPLIKAGKKGARPALSALNAKIQEKFGKDLSKLSTKEVEALIDHLAEQGITLSMDGAIEAVTNPEGKKEESSK